MHEGSWWKSLELAQVLTKVSFLEVSPLNTELPQSHTTFWDTTSEKKKKEKSKDLKFLMTAHCQNQSGN